MTVNLAISKKQRFASPPRQRLRGASERSSKRPSDLKVDVFDLDSTFLYQISEPLEGGIGHVELRSERQPVGGKTLRFRARDVDQVPVLEHRRQTVRKRFLADEGESFADRSDSAIEVEKVGSERDDFDGVSLRSKELL